MPCHPSNREGRPDGAPEDSAGTREPSFPQAGDLDGCEQSVRHGDRDPAGFDRSGRDLRKNEESHRGANQGSDLPLGRPGDVVARAERPPKRSPKIGESDRENEHADVADEGEGRGKDGEAHEAKRKRRRGDEQNTGAGVAERGEVLVHHQPAVEGSGHGPSSSEEAGPGWSALGFSHRFDNKRAKGRGAAAVSSGFAAFQASGTRSAKGWGRGTNCPGKRRMSWRSHSA